MTTTVIEEGAIYAGAEQRADARSVPRLEWFRAARFGICAPQAGVWVLRVPNALDNFDNTVVTDRTACFLRQR